MYMHVKWKKCVVVVVFHNNALKMQSIICTCYLEGRSKKLAEICVSNISQYQNLQST